LKQIVVGNSIATIAFLDQIGNQHDVLWLKDGEKPNGIWGGFKYRERILDFAMINFEFDLYKWNAGKNFQDYNQLKINDCSRFISMIKEYILRHLTIKQLPEIKIYTDSGLIEDFLISNNLADLKKYLSNDKEEVENKSIRKSINPHPQFKNDSNFEDEFLRIPLNRYVETIYGSEISKKIYSRWGNRLVGKKYLSIPTLRHRSIWLPLYYPETIINYTKENISLSPTQFFYPEIGTISEFVNELYDKLNNFFESNIICIILRSVFLLTKFLVADYLLDDFYVRNFWWALLFSMILSFINSILGNMLGTNKEEDQNQQRLE
jgi:hypothetical protein